MKKYDKEVYKTRDELLHLWANKKIVNSRLIGKYRIIDSELYYDGEQLTLNKYGFLFIKEFDVTGRNHYRLLYYFPDANNIKICYELPINYTITWLVNEFKQLNDNTFNYLALYKEVLTNKKLKLNNTTFDIRLPLNLNNDIYNGFLNTTIDIYSLFPLYRGWTKNRNLVYKIPSIKISNIVNDGLGIAFTTEEINYLKYRVWINTYKSKGHCDSLLNVFNNAELKEAHELNIHTIKCKIKEQKEIERKLERQKNVIKELKLINNFRLNNFNFNFYYLGYVVFKITCDNPFIIKSSLGMPINIHAAKKAIELFRLKYKGHELVARFKYEGIIKQEIPHLNEKDELYYIEEDCIKIGCHVIPESEINEFLKFYNLDW